MCDENMIYIYCSSIQIEIALVFVRRKATCSEMIPLNARLQVRNHTGFVTIRFSTFQQACAYMTDGSNFTIDFLSCEK